MANVETSVIETKVKVSADIDPNLAKGNEEMQKALSLMNELKKAKGVPLLKFSKSPNKLFVGEADKSKYDRAYISLLAKHYKSQNLQGIEQMRKEYVAYSPANEIAKKITETKVKATAPVVKKEVEAPKPKTTSTTNEAKTGEKKPLTDKQKGRLIKRIGAVNLLVPNRLDPNEEDEITIANAEVEAQAIKAKNKQEEKVRKENAKILKEIEKEEDSEQKEALKERAKLFRARAKLLKAEGDIESSIYVKNYKPTEEDLEIGATETSGEVNTKAELVAWQNKQYELLEKQFGKEEARKRRAIANLFKSRGQSIYAEAVLQGANMSVDGVPYDKVNPDYVDMIRAREKEQAEREADRAKIEERYKKEQYKEEEERRKQKERADKQAVSTQFAIVKSQNALVKSQVLGGKAFNAQVNNAGRGFFSSVIGAMKGLGFLPKAFGVGYVAHKLWDTGKRAVEFSDRTVRQAADESILGLTLKKIGAGKSQILGASLGGESLEALDRLFVKYGGKKGEGVESVNTIMEQISMLRYGGGQELLKNAAMFGIDVFDEKGEVKKPIDILQAVFEKIRASDAIDKFAIARTFGLSQAQTYAAISGADIGEANIADAVGKFDDIQEKMSRQTWERTAWEDIKNEKIKRNEQIGGFSHLFSYLHMLDKGRRTVGTYMFGVGGLSDSHFKTAGEMGFFPSPDEISSLPSEGANYSPIQNGNSYTNNGDIITNIYGGDAQENARRVAEEVQKVVQPAEASN